MGFEKGHRKYGGKQKGSKHKGFRAKSVDELINKLENENFDAIAELIQLYKDSETSAANKVKIASLLVNKLIPDPKAQDTSAIDKSKVNINVTFEDDDKKVKSENVDQKEKN